MSNAILSLIGLCKKAGRQEVGEEPVGAAARARHRKKESGGFDYPNPPLIVWRVKRAAVRRFFPFAIVRQCSVIILVYGAYLSTYL